LVYLVSFSKTHFFLRQAVQAFFQVEEITNYCHQQMKEEEGRRKSAVRPLMWPSSNKELKKQSLEEQRERKSAVAALDSVEKQTES